MEISSIVVNVFCGRFIDGGCVPGPVPGLLFTDTELGPDVGNGYLDIHSNISGLNGFLKYILLMLR